MKYLKSLASPTLSLLFLFACCTATAQVVLRFDHRAEGRKLVLDSATYKTNTNDPLTISLLQYYISNIEFIKSNGEKYIIPKAASFFLVKESIDSTKNIVLNVPDGVYAAVSFLVGVDSTTSTLGIAERTGVLDPGRDMAASESMYWTWNSGYIFFKMEGSSPAIPADKTGFRQFEFHIGGYGGYNTPTINNIRRVTIDLHPSGPLRVRSPQKAIVHVRFNALQALDRIDLKKDHHIMLTPASSRIADNYAAGFMYGGTEYTSK